MDDNSYRSHLHLRSITLSDNVLNKTIYYPQGGMSLHQKFWWQAFGMFGFMLLLSQVKPFYGFDFWISSILLIAMMLSVKQSGAHYNPSMTLSNFLIKFSPQKINLTFMWTYFKAEVVPAFIAFNIAFYTRGYFYPPPIPVNDWDSYRIILGELIGTFMLSFFLQRVCNSQTTFTTSDIETYSFVVVFVYVARRFAVTSGNSINPVATLAAACAAVVQCAFGPLRYFYLFVIGDLLGSIAGSLFYNCLYEPNLHVSRMEEERNSMVLKQHSLFSPRKSTQNRDDSQLRFSKFTDIQMVDEQHDVRMTALQNYVSRIEHEDESALSENLEFEMFSFKTPNMEQLKQ